MSSRTTAVPARAPSSVAPTPGTIYVGLDVHKDSDTVAVLPAGAPALTRVDTPANAPASLRR